MGIWRRGLIGRIGCLLHCHDDCVRGDDDEARSERKGQKEAKNGESFVD